jgi:hypothetical protein
MGDFERSQQRCATVKAPPAGLPAIPAYDLLPYILDTEEKKESFWKDVDRRGDDECWLWLKGGSKSGQPRRVYLPAQKLSEAQRQTFPENIRPHFTGESINFWPHQVAWYLVRGTSTGRLFLTCGNKLCVNPNHRSRHRGKPHEPNQVGQKLSYRPLLLWKVSMNGYSVGNFITPKRPHRWKEYDPAKEAPALFRIFASLDGTPAGFANFVRDYGGLIADKERVCDIVAHHAAIRQAVAAMESPETPADIERLINRGLRHGTCVQIKGRQRVYAPRNLLGLMWIQIAAAFVGG